MKCYFKILRKMLLRRKVVLYLHSDSLNKRLAKVAQLIERHLAKVEVAGLSPVSRSPNHAFLPGTHDFSFSLPAERIARVVELVDTQDLKSCDH